MSNVKTAVSIEEGLFRRAESLSKELGVSRSRLFTMAMAEFLTRHEARKILKELNEVHGKPPGEADRSFVDGGKALLARMTEDERW